jgi:hypothetical protein
MSNEPDERIERLAREKLDGKSYSAIRQELSDAGMGDEEIGALIRRVDERVLDAATKQGVADRGKQWYRSGLILAVAGLTLVIVYKAGLILNNMQALLVYSPFFAGILLMLYGRSFLRKQYNPAGKSPGAIRKRRPYK